MYYILKGSSHVNTMNNLIDDLKKGGLFNKIIQDKIDGNRNKKNQNKVYNELFIDEITAENNRVVVTARIKAIHLGELSGIAATGKTVNFSFVIRYEIENEKIVNHWMIADQMLLMQQLGVVPIEEVAPLMNLK